MFFVVVKRKEDKKKESMLAGNGKLLNRFMNSAKAQPVLLNLVFVGSIHYKVL